MMIKGNAVVGQSGGPTSAINATLAGVILGCEAAHNEGVIGTLYGMHNGIEGFLADRLSDLGKDVMKCKKTAIPSSGTILSHVKLNF